MTEISLGDWALEVSPPVGGAIRRLTWQGQDILRPLPQGSADVLQSGCFPLVPYANRIADGRFRFGGRDVSLPVLPSFAPHALHGDGWLAAWRQAGGDGSSIVLTYGHDAGRWPWSYAAVQTFTLSAAGLEIALSITNTGDKAMPAGLGLHPYFVAGDDTRLFLDASSVWASKAGIPTGLHPPSEIVDWSVGQRVVDAPFVDHCYADWRGTARLEDHHHTVTITASQNAAWAHVYAPGERFVCIEPVTHRPDAVHAADHENSGLTALEANQTLAMAMRISAAARS